MKSIYKVLLILMVLPLFAMELPEKQEKSDFDILPNEIIQDIIKALPTQAQGDDNQTRLLNAAQDIRKLAQVDTRLRDLLNDPKTVKFLINEVANRYADGNKIAAAVALATSGSGKWLANNYLDFNEIENKQVNEQIEYAIKNNKLGIIKFLFHYIPLSYFDVSDLFVLALQNNFLYVIELFLDNKVIADKLGLNYLDERRRIINVALFAENPNKKIIQKIFNKTGFDINSRDEMGTVLMNAIGNNNIALVKLLLSLGANVDKPLGEGSAPLHLAASRGSNEIIRILLDEGANINAIDDLGESPLFRAAFSLHPESVQLLLEAGAIVTFGDLERVREYPINFLHGKEKQHELIIKLLEDQLKKQ